MFLRLLMLDVELAVLDTSHECLPLILAESQGGLEGVLGVAHLHTRLVGSHRNTEPRTRRGVTRGFETVFVNLATICSHTEHF